MKKMKQNFNSLDVIQQKPLDPLRDLPQSLKIIFSFELRQWGIL